MCDICLNGLYGLLDIFCQFTVDEEVTAMKFLRLLGVVSALILAGCASRQGLVPQVQQAVAEDGAKTVTVAPERAVCSRPQCPVLAASWSSAKAGQAVLAVGLPYQAAEVTGADFHFGGSQVVRVRSRSRSPAPALGFPATAFDVPLSLVGQLAYTSRSWIRVYTADGRSVDETLNSGEQRGKAVESMSYLLTAIESASGKAVPVEGNRGGLLERLGGSGK